MNKKIKVFAVMGISIHILAASHSYAASLLFDSRVDAESSHYNDAEKANGFRDYNRFSLRVMRLDLKGKFDDQISYRLRYRVSTPALTRVNTTTGAPSNNLRDNLNSSVDLAFVSHKISDTFTLTAGKFNSDIGGWEGQTPIPDIYLASEARLDQTPLVWHTGVKLGFNFNDQSLGLQLANQDSDRLEGGRLTQKTPLAGINYSGNFIDGHLRPTASVFFETLDSSTTQQKNTYISAGLRWNEDGLNMDLDFNLDRKNGATFADQTDQIRSITLDVAKRFGHFTPRLKVELSQVELATSAITTAKEDIFGYQAGVEYFPTEQTTFRYHLMAFQKLATAENKPDRNALTVLLGLRINHDFLSLGTQSP